MNLLLLHPNEIISDNQVVITDERLVHLHQVLKVKLGDQVRTGLINGLIGQGTVVSLSAKEVTLSLDLLQESPKASPIILAVALPRPPTMVKVIQSATEMGVKQLIFFQTSRVEKSFWQSTKLEPEVLEGQIRHGLEQCMDTIWPTISFHRRFIPFVEDVIPLIAPSPTVRLVADPSGPMACPREPIQNPTLLLVGPEGGFIPYELEVLREHQFQTIHLGSRILRVEHAVMNLLSKMS